MSDNKDKLVPQPIPTNTLTEGDSVCAPSGWKATVVKAGDILVAVTKSGNVHTEVFLDFESQQTYAQCRNLSREISNAFDFGSIPNGMSLDELYTIKSIVDKYV